MGVKSSQVKVGHVIGLIRPGGGPSGYLYNLKKIAGTHPERKFEILPFIESEDRSSDLLPSTFLALIKLLKRCTPEQRSMILDALYFVKSKRSQKQYDEKFIKLIQEFPSLIFHSRYEADYYINSFKTPGQKVYVMQHSPSDHSLEILSNYEALIGGGIDRKKFLRHMRQRELLTYDKADGVIAPSRYSLDGYFSGDMDLRQKYESILDQKLFTVMTGVPMIEATHQAETRQLINPENKKYVVGYFGRYQAQKGYDMFLELVKSSFHNNDIQFICAGHGGLKPEAGEYSNLTDLGWISQNIQDYMAAVDLIVSPNESCYFDLAILEALSLGTPVLATSVGGNHIFDDRNPGVTTFSRSITEIKISMIEILGNLPERSIVKDFFLENFSSQKFFENHQALASDIQND